jgi:hypothetical protein
MRATDKIREALDWCELRGLDPARVELFPRYVEVVLPHADTRDGWVGQARAAGCTTVKVCRGVWAVREPGDGPRVRVHAGGWWDRVPDEQRDDVVDGLRRDLLTVEV